MVLSKCAICGTKKSRFVKNQEAKGPLSNLGIKTPLSTNIGRYFVLNMYIKMNEIVNTFLLDRDKFKPEMHLKQPGFTYSSGRPFTKSKERIQKFKETRDTRHIYKNELDKACFQHDMAYGDFKDIAKRTVSDKVLTDKAFNVAKNPKYDGYPKGHASMICNFFDKKSKGSGVANSRSNKIYN